MRHLAIGDIHGCAVALETLADFVSVQNDDCVIALGDYTDRGPDSKRVLEWLIEFAAHHRLVALRGNHDVMMLQAREHRVALDDWVARGGDTTLASYAPAGQPGRLELVPDSHWQFLESTRPWYQTDSHFFVHANVYPQVPLESQPDFMLYWEKFRDPPPHQSGKLMVCGHTAQKSGLPRNRGHAVCIDTRVYDGGWLTCLDVATGHYWQANESGETRRDRLREAE